MGIYITGRCDDSATLARQEAARSANRSTGDAPPSRGGGALPATRRTGAGGRGAAAARRSNLDDARLAGLARGDTVILHRHRLSLAVTGCGCLGICTVILLSLLSLSAEMKVPPRARLDAPCLGRAEQACHAWHAAARGSASHGLHCHSDAAWYISFVILHTEYTKCHLNYRVTHA
jgi:hypothetical protein